MNSKFFKFSLGILFPACLMMLSSTVAAVVFSKEFTPGTIDYGQRSTLTFTVDNEGGEFPLYNMAFTDPLPPGVIIADPANSSSDCVGGMLTAEAGSEIITYNNFNYPALPADSSCSISVDIVGGAAGVFLNVTSELIYYESPGGTPYTALPATATLTVNPPGTIGLTKSFVDDPVPPGGEVTLEFSLTNYDRNEFATDISFIDDLSTVLAGLAVVGPLPQEPCGPGSALAEVSSILEFSGGSLASGGSPASGASCSFSVLLGVPIEALPGIYDNSTSAVLATVAADEIEGAPATDSLFIAPTPLFTKSFSEDLVAPGSSLTLGFSITNSSPDSSASEIEFVDPIGEILPGITAPDALPIAPCGAGSELQFIPTTQDFPAEIRFTGGLLGAGGTCTFNIALTIPVNTPTGTYVNVTDPITAVIGGTLVIGPPAVDDLGVVAAPKLQKSFEKPSVAPGALVNLQFTLTHALEVPADANGIAFTDSLGAMLTGAVAEGLPINNVCGTGSSVTGTDEISMHGGKLAPGESCSFDVAVRIPADASIGNYINETSNVTANVGGGGLQVLSNPATAPLNVSTLILEKTFLDNPVAAGSTASLEFTITNSSSIGVTGIIFTDDLKGFTAIGLPAADVCGAGSSMSGTGILTLADGSLPANGTCSWTVDIAIPIGTVPNRYSNLTSQVEAAGGITGPAARDVLEVTEPMAFTKSFASNAQVAAGATIQLDFQIANLSSATITDIGFTDDLNAMIPGASAVTATQTDICGAGSTLGGQAKITFSGGVLNPGANCVFSVDVLIPGDAAPGDHRNLTSSIASMVDSGSLTGNPAVADLLVLDAPLFSKAFTPVSILAGQSSTLTFTIDNQVTYSAAATDIELTDNFPNGMVIADVPSVQKTCTGGTVTAVPGSSTFSYSGGTVPADSECTVSVHVSVAKAGDYQNTTADLTSSSGNSGVANASLHVDPQPGFTKEFKPATMLLGDFSTLIFTIDNTLSTVAVSDINLRDNLPAGMAVASQPNAQTDCGPGSLTASPGSGLISYVGGTLADGSSCTVQVDIVGLMAGEHINTTEDLTSTSGNSGSAQATLMVDALDTICFPGPDIYVIPAGIIFSGPGATEISAEGGIMSEGEMIIDLPHSLILRAPFVDFAPLLQVQEGEPGAQLQVISEPVICNGGE